MAAVVCVVVYFTSSVHCAHIPRAQNGSTLAPHADVTDEEPLQQFDSYFQLNYIDIDDDDDDERPMAYGGGGGYRVQDHVEPRPRESANHVFLAFGVLAVLAIIICMYAGTCDKSKRQTEITIRPTFETNSTGRASQSDVYSHRSRATTSRCNRSQCGSGAARLTNDDYVHAAAATPPGGYFSRFAPHRDPFSFQFMRHNNELWRSAQNLLPSRFAYETLPQVTSDVRAPLLATFRDEETSSEADSSDYDVNVRVNGNDAVNMVNEGSTAASAGPKNDDVNNNNAASVRNNVNDDDIAAGNGNAFEVLESMNGTETAAVDSAAEGIRADRTDNGTSNAAILIHDHDSDAAAAAAVDVAVTNGSATERGDVTSTDRANDGHALVQLA